MAEIKLIKARINSVSSTSQLTRAMQLISASKMVRAQARAESMLPYAEMIYDIASEIGDPGDYRSPLLRRAKQVKNICIVVVGTGRGFVGGLIASLSLLITRLQANLKKKYPEAVIHGVSVHNTGLKILQRCGINAELHFKEYFENRSFEEFSPVYEALETKFAAKEYDQVYLVYTHYINTIVQKPYFKKILPVSLKEIQAEFSLILSEEDQAKADEKKRIGKDLREPGFVFEPSKAEVLDFLLPEYFHKQILSAIFESIASEHSARMVAMKNATDNAEKLKQALTLKYNRQRQAQITQQLIEVVNGRMQPQTKTIF